jgi:uncharacterized protein (UPF0548 family)
VDSGPRDSRAADAALPSIRCGLISIRSLAVTRSRHVTIIRDCRRKCSRSETDAVAAAVTITARTLMFLAQCPSRESIERFVRDSQGLPLSYSPVGIAAGKGVGRADETLVTIGRGEADFERARAALLVWKQFDIGWVETFPPNAPITVGTVVAVLVRHFGFWSLNGCRIVYRVGSSENDTRFGFAYGTLTNHAAAGEELFEVFVHPQTEDVMYRIKATSSPRGAFAHLGYPLLRALQTRFRRHSAVAMKQATRGNS